MENTWETETQKQIFTVNKEKTVAVVTEEKTWKGNESDCLGSLCWTRWSRSNIFSCSSSLAASHNGLVGPTSRAKVIVPHSLINDVDSTFSNNNQLIHIHSRDRKASTHSGFPETLQPCRPLICGSKLHWPASSPVANTQLRRDGELQFADSRERPVDLLTGLPGLFGNLNSEMMAKQRSVDCNWASLKGRSCQKHSNANKYVFNDP